MDRRKDLVALAVVLGIVFLVIAVIYLVEPASSLPSFFPGHEAGSSHHHAKHGIAAFLVGLAFFVFAWFNSGRRRRRAGQLAPDGTDHLLPGRVLGLLQGVAELFPDLEPRPQRDPPAALRLEHPPERRLLPRLPRRDPLRHGDRAALCFFWQGLGADLRGLGRSLRDRQIGAEDTDAKLGWLLVAGTIPAGILGLPLEHRCAPLRLAETAAIFLASTGRCSSAPSGGGRRAPATTADDDDKRMLEGGLAAGVRVGAAQALALIPGFSRSGVTMGGGLLVGLSNEDAARFAFLLATPIIVAAGVLKLPELPARGERGARPGARRRALRGAQRLFRRPVPDAVLRDRTLIAVRRLLPLRRDALRRSTSR